jgi:hypothetical protein
MHLELPKTSLNSFKDFLKHYLMIVLSILTALGLEAWIEHVHHRHAAEAASVQIDAEIRSNLKEVRSALAQDSHQADAFERIRDKLQQDLASNTPDAVAVQQIQQFIAQQSSLNLNMRWPTLRQEAWDVAVANQSATWLDERHMYRYSAAYAQQRGAASTLSANLALVINGPRMMDAFTDLRVGHVQPLEFLHVVSQMTAALQQARVGLSSLQDQLQNALPEAQSSAH